MSYQELSCGLEYSVANDMKACLFDALNTRYAFVVFPVVHPRFEIHQFPDNNSSTRSFTRSDMILESQDWNVRIVGSVSSNLDVDSPCLAVRQRDENRLTTELTYCKSIGVPAIMMKIKGRNTVNLSRILHTFFSSSHQPLKVWATVPMICKSTLRKNTTVNGEVTDEKAAFNETWLWWSIFHEQMEWSKKVDLVLEVSADLPSPNIMQRWLGEPIKAVILPTSIFITNKHGYPILSSGHQNFVSVMMVRGAQFVIRGAPRHNKEYYIKYLNCLNERARNNYIDPINSYAKGWEDYLQTPLQPLADHLDTHTYNVFEKDPVKYRQYQSAIVKALTDLKKNEIHCNNDDEEVQDENRTIIVNGDSPDLDKINVVEECGDSDTTECDKVFTVMVLGAGRGPLVRAVLNASDITKTKLKVFAVEKNPSAVIVLTALVRELWQDRNVQVIQGDMRAIYLEHCADIIVSELLGSWGDNELSPECLDGAAHLLSPTGISIPSAYTSYAAPISCPLLWASARAIPTSEWTPPHVSKNFETLWVVYMKTKYDIDDAKPIFTFNHPAKGISVGGKVLKDYRDMPLTDNRRSTVVKWTASQDTVLHGFAGYFDCTLYGDEMISILPSTHSPGMTSWFPIFLPVETPIRIHKGDEIEGYFWRCTDGRRVWYEWIVKVGDTKTRCHNVNGRSSEMLL